MALEEPNARDRIRNKNIEMLTNSCFLLIDHAKDLMSIEQKNKSKTSIISAFENKSVIMFDLLGNISKAFDSEEAEPTFQFP